MHNFRPDRDFGWGEEESLATDRTRQPLKVLVKLQFTSDRYWISREKFENHHLALGGCLSTMACECVPRLMMMMFAFQWCGYF